MLENDLNNSIALLRREYALKSLLESNVAADPIEQFRVWFHETLNAELVEPNAMTLATADASGKPSARIVLLKEFSEKGFAFHTNYNSRKGQEIAANPQVSLLFFWDVLERQVRVEGKIEKLNREESDEYFRTRPRSGQIGAWASQQSETIESREKLDQIYAELEKKFCDGVIPIPPHWGGYRVVPAAMEFWQGRPSRLHDRLLYTRDAAGKWSIRRLSP